MTALSLLLASAEGVSVPIWLAGPFALLLLLIAVAPLLPDKAKHFWEHYYPHVSLGLGLFVVGFYILKFGDTHTPLHTGIEYFSFIALIGSLFVVAGGIHINIRGEARPAGNTAFLLVGAVLANLIGTTGASMVLIRPWIRMNRYRITAFHIVFFIFVVSNLGGALTPIGDPPLFLGFLHGIPFFWITQHTLLPWALAIGLILLVFYFFDRQNFLRAPKQVREEETGKRPLVSIDGGHNVLFLGIVVVAVFLPERYFLRELVMLGAAIASYKFTNPKIREWNVFSFGPIREVAFLFAGIFLTMMPALGYLKEHGREFPLRQPIHYYFASGSLSAVLDNAPTYLTFLQLGETAVVPLEVQEQAKAANPGNPAGEERHILDWMREEKDIGNFGTPAFLYILAVSMGAVFFGAMTYIGNGPNFMVKSIAESASVKTPTFFGYIFRFSLPILLPILIIVGYVFL